MIHLHVHTEYSYKKSILKIKELIDFAKSENDNVFCITDIGSLTSFVKAFKAAEKENLKFIPGCELVIKPKDENSTYFKEKRISFLKKQLNLKRTTDEMRKEFEEELEVLNNTNTVQNHSLIVLAKNITGFNNLMNIYSSDIEENDVFLTEIESVKKFKEGLIILSGGYNSEILFLIRNNRLEEAEELLISYKEEFGDNFYTQVEFQNIELSEEEEINGILSEKESYIKLIELSDKHQIPYIVSNNVMYMKKDEKIKYRLFNNMMSKEDLDFNEDNNFLMTKDELNNHLSEIYGNEIVQKGFDTIDKIIESCETIKMPNAPGLIDSSEELIELCEKGWEKLRKGTEYEKESRERLEYELKVINGRNFSQYFIKVYNIVKLAKELGILIGPGRGSACGCEVSYLLEIIKVDPIKYGLYFERFLNPERAGFPDIDIDMASIPTSISINDINNIDEDDEDGEIEGKGESASRNLLVDQLLKREYFKFAGFIQNEVTASALVLFKDLAKFYEIPYSEANKISTDSVYSEKLKEKEYTGWLKEAVDTFGFEWEDYWELLDSKMKYCYELAGIPYNTSIAASGVIMSDADTLLPVRNGCIGFNGVDLESVGHIKFDLLSINTLNQIQFFKGLDVDWNDYFDPDTWQVFKDGDTDFVFQFSSPGMKNILKSVKPDNISTLAEINALYRPGPIGMGMIEKYIAMKTGNFTEETELTEEELVLKDLLKATFGDNHTGLVIFQEDVMKICQIGAGFTLAEADDIRKAMGKKKQELLDSYKGPFIERWKLSGDPTKIWDTMVDFAKYAFNKSHAVGYAIVAYQTAYIWAHNRDQFLEYSLNYDTKKRYNIALDKCNELNYKFIYPNLDNISETKFKVSDNKVFLPGKVQEKFNSYVDLLFGESKDVYNLIYKGVCDNLTKDRFALSELVSTCMAKAKESALYMEPSGVKFTNLHQILDGLVTCGGIINYSDEQDGIHVWMKRARSNPNEIIFHKDNSDYCKYNICKYDNKMFGSIRGGILSNLPQINTTAIERNLNTLKERLSIKGFNEKQIYYKMKDMLDDYMRNYFSSPRMSTFDNIYAIVKDSFAYQYSTKLIVEFDNVPNEILYVKGNDALKVKTFSKNALVKMKIIYSPFIKKSNQTFVYDFDILEIEEIKPE